MFTAQARACFDSAVTADTAARMGRTCSGDRYVTAYAPRTRLRHTPAAQQPGYEVPDAQALLIPFSLVVSCALSPSPEYNGTYLAVPWNASQVPYKFLLQFPTVQVRAQLATARQRCSVIAAERLPRGGALAPAWRASVSSRLRLLALHAQTVLPSLVTDAGVLVGVNYTAPPANVSWVDPPTVDVRSGNPSGNFRPYIYLSDWASCSAAAGGLVVQGTAAGASPAPPPPPPRAAPPPGAPPAAGASLTAADLVALLGSLAPGDKAAVRAALGVQVVSGAAPGGVAAALVRTARVPQCPSAAAASGTAQAAIV